MDHQPHGQCNHEVCFRVLQEHSAIPVLYASSWLLTAFASDFPIFFASRVMDIILTDRYVVAIMKVCCCSLQKARHVSKHCLCHMMAGWAFLRP